MKTAPDSSDTAHMPPVWHSALKLAASAYRVTRTFPEEERFVLTAQIRRAAVSILANISEGWARHGNRQLRSFLQIAYGSTRECEALIRLSEHVQVMKPADAKRVLGELNDVSRQLLGWLRSQTAKRAGA